MNQAHILIAFLFLALRLLFFTVERLLYLSAWDVGFVRKGKSEGMASLSSRFSYSFSTSVQVQGENAEFILNSTLGPAAEIP